MSPKLKCHHKMWAKINVIKTKTWPESKCYQNWNVTKTKMSQDEISLKLKLTETEILPKLNTEIEMSPKTKCHQDWNVTKTEILPRLKCP